MPLASFSLAEVFASFSRSALFYLLLWWTGRRQPSGLVALLVSREGVLRRSRSPHSTLYCRTALLRRAWPVLDCLYFWPYFSGVLTQMSQRANLQVLGLGQQASLGLLDGPQTVPSVFLRTPHSVAEPALFILFEGHQCSPGRSHPCRVRQPPWTSACPFEQSSLIPESICSLLWTWQPQTPGIRPAEQ